MYDQKVIWITGASSGIGAELARQLSQRGARLILSARRQEELEQVRGTCHRPHQHWVLPVDLTAMETHQLTVEQALALADHVDIMIHNAGIAQRSLVTETQMEIYRQVMEVNYFGTVSLTRALLPALIARGSGHLVVTSSLAGLFGSQSRSAYCASKHALHGFFESLQLEVWQEGIRVTLVCPGFVDTEIASKALQGEGSAPVDPNGLPTSTGISVEACVRQILRGLPQHPPRLVVGGRETWAVLLKRLSPRLFQAVVRRAQASGGKS